VRLNRYAKFRSQVLIAVLVVAGGCSHAAAPVAVVPECVGQLAVAASQGTAPEISWSPTCGINRLSISDVNAPVGTISTTWAISSVSGSFLPPVQYGILPTGATADAPLVALRAGRTYAVTLYRAGGEAIALASGTATFAP
jgi:hypothetical protein